MPHHLVHRRPGRVPGRPLSLIGAAAISLAAALTFAIPAHAAPDPGSVVKVNQVAYAPGLPKQGTVVSSSTTPIAWTLRNAAGTTVASGQTTVRGADTLSGDNVHIADFSSFDTAGTGYVLSAAGASSFPFDISADPLRRLRYDALAFFYHQRSGTPILSQYVGSQYARPAGHVNVAPNQGDNNVECRVSCGYTMDVRGGWYDAGDHGKYGVNSGIAAWQLINEYERTLYIPGADHAALGDNTLAIPERGNGVPDILDEARWEVEFLLKMQVPDGRADAGMVRHKVGDQNWTGLPLRPDQDPQPRVLSAVTTAATLNLAAVAAQAARVWQTIDPTFSTRARTAAQKAYTAAKANPARYADANDTNGAGTYLDNNVTDEFYWAAAELYVTTGSATYRTDLTGSSLFRGVGFNQRGFDWWWVPGLGDATLAMVPNGLSAADIAATRAAFTGYADRLLNQANSQGYPAPTGATASYVWGSSGTVANSANIMAMAYDFTGQSKYRTGVYQALDYLFGRNPYNQSYVTGYGERASRNVHHRFWANQVDASLPIAPPGALAGGPNTGLEDPVAQAQLAGCRPQKCYLDDINAWSVNEVAINWNSALAWLSFWAAEKSGSANPPDTTPPSTPTNLGASATTATSTNLTWTASTDNVAVTGYDIYRRQGTTGTFILIGSSTGSSFAATDLSAATQYQFNVIAHDAVGNSSTTSANVTVTTSSSADTIAPSSPGNLAASATTSAGTTLSWTASTDNVAVTGYDILRATGASGGTFTQIATGTNTSFTDGGLSANTSYRYQVRARDAAGNLSTVSNTVTVITQPGGGTGGCSVTATAQTQWSGGYVIQPVAVTNTSTAPITAWTVTFTLPAGHTIAGSWNATLTVNGQTVTARSVSHNSTLAPGARAEWGFQAQRATGDNSLPSGYTCSTP